MRYNYWLLRYVPDSARGEFVNVGVLVGSDDNADWALRRAPSLARASRLGGDAQLIEDWLERFQAFSRPEISLIASRKPGSIQRLSYAYLDRIRRHLNNTFQVTPPTPVRTTSADAAADRLLMQLVSAPEPRTRSTDRAAAVRELQEAYHRVDALRPRDVQHRVRIHVGRQQTRFEFAIGQVNIAQLSQVWSFRRQAIDGLAQEIQAASYAIKRLREDGGYLVNPQRSTQAPIGLPPDVAVRVLYVPPESVAQREVFADAEDAWNDLNVVPFALGEERRLAEEASALLRAG